MEKNELDKLEEYLCDHGYHVKQTITYLIC